MTNFPIGGNITRHVKVWEKLTSDPWILSVVRGLKLHFWTTPVQEVEPRPFNLSKDQRETFNRSVSELLEKEVIERTGEEQGQFISNIFVRPKPNGKVRLILDLTELNKFLVLQHFKLDNLDTALNMVEADCSMATIDLQDAYFTVGIHPDYRKFLKFRWGGQLYRFKAVPMGLACAPYVFTKLLRPVFSQMRSKGRQCFCYLDDVFVAETTAEKCKETAREVYNVLKDLGFKIQDQKSQLNPEKVVKFLGFLIDSIKMEVYLPPDKVIKIVEVCKSALDRGGGTIQEIASVVGLMNAYAKAVDYGDNHIKKLEIEKIRALKREGDNFKSLMSVSAQGKKDLRWWISQADKSVRKIGTRSPIATLITDASNLGWGAVFKQETAQGKWTEKEEGWHINEKELLAVLFGLKTLVHNLENCTLRVLSDNMTTVNYVNKMGGGKVPQMQYDSVSYLVVV